VIKITDIYTAIFYTVIKQRNTACDLWKSIDVEVSEKVNLG